MCREGAWFELTAEVTSVDRHSKPAARSFFIGKVQHHATIGTHACMQDHMGIWCDKRYRTRARSAKSVRYHLEDCVKLRKQREQSGTFNRDVGSDIERGHEVRKRERKDITCIGLRELQKTL